MCLEYKHISPPGKFVTGIHLLQLYVYIIHILIVMQPYFFNSTHLLKIRSIQ